MMMDNQNGIENLAFAISAEEIAMAERSLESALKAGASGVQVSLDKARTDIYALLNGEIDNIRQTGDRALTFRIFADGKYGVFSTNRLDDRSIGHFMKQAVENVRLMAEDPYRRLPYESETAKNAVRGDEMELCWYDYDSVTAEDKMRMVREASIYGKEGSSGEGWKLISEEAEYNNTLTDTLLIDSNGLWCRQLETSFEVCSQVSVEDAGGNIYSGLWWDYAISPEGIRGSGAGLKAVREAVSQINPLKKEGGCYRMVVDNRVSGRLVQPVLNALGGRAIFQKSSFLTDALGKKIFGDGFTLVDRPGVKGMSGSILFDSEGRACIDRDIVSEGVVKEYFISTYMSGKLGMEPTSESAMRPVLLPYVKDSEKLTSALREGLDPERMGRDRILGLCGDGILVTEFNGGNCNGATGDFSYGVGGYEFRNGIITGPVESMVITGNMVSLWNSLIAAGDDPRNGLSRQIPTIAFENVVFSA